eukprot:TRINITY_DN3590_c0_g1_i1.p1 TRINITY_DN3590_c0_g1~~TRINITY_DN3590_c0_g1_i1.p1  ORF type:complete len:809 (-),score=201.18 TRINITY_DN3590_c0_g1_i1:68-2494(-)
MNKIGDDGLANLLQNLGKLNSAQFRSLTLFVSPTSLSDTGDISPDQWIPQIATLISHSKSGDLNQLLEFIESRGSGDPNEPFPSSLLNSWSKSSLISTKHLESCLGLIASLQLLSKLLNSLSIMQLMKLFEVLPSAPPIQQLQLLQQIQQLFSQLQPETLLNLHSQLASATPGTEHELLLRILSLPSEYFQLYQPLRILLGLEQDELLRLQSSVPQLLPVQMLQLLQLLQLQPFDVLELRNLIVPPEDDDMDDDLPPPINLLGGSHPPFGSEKKMNLQIVEQPPEKSVYKRNLKPNPMVMIVGDQRHNDGNLYVVPRLIRCDTFKEEPKFLTGNRPMRVSSGRVVNFRKLKVTTTSHQQQETLFCICFELRKYSQAPMNVSPNATHPSGMSQMEMNMDPKMEEDGDYEVLDSVFSNPICVLSHSTQMKPVPTVAPIISEVIPGFGPTSGGTRVAILGANFADSPAARIRFDSTEVMPIFHGVGTLICHTPQHPPGAAQVKVSNASKKWSEDHALFIYDERLASNPEETSTIRVQGQKGSHSQNNSQSNQRQSNQRTQSQAQETKGHHTVQTTNLNLDSFCLKAENPFLRQTEFGSMEFYQTLFICSVWRGEMEEIKSLSNLNLNYNWRDQRGYCALHYAAALGRQEIVEYLLEIGSQADIRDVKSGRSPLGWACIEGHSEIVDLLVAHGSNLDLMDFSGLVPFTMALLCGNRSIAIELLEAGASVFQTGISGESMLHIASAMGDTQICELLLSNGAYINALEEEGESPLFWAVREGKMEAVKLLVERGADLSIQNDDEEKVEISFAKN